ncbi:MAG: group 1 glycosyl transferase [Anaerolineales bacterium]
MNRCFATIVSGNYLAYASVLADSLARHAPGQPLQVLVVDRASDTLRGYARTLGLMVLFAEELGLPDFERLAYKYDILEFNTALKPSFLKHLFAAGFDRVVYVDPDICFYASPRPIEQALNDAAIVLTPHALEPVLDGERPSDVDFLRLGVFNLGFIALRRSAQAAAMLDWWEQRCLGLGFNDIGFGTFVDQKWADLIPHYFSSVHVLRHKGCNVAYWNLHERQLQLQDGQYAVDDQPLVFFHFSGADAGKPSQLSKYQTRHALPAEGVLARIVAAYCEALQAAGHEQLRRMDYSFACLDDGRPITATMRRALCCDGVTERAPFRADSPFQRLLRQRGLASLRGMPPKGAAAVTPENLQQLGRKLAWADVAVRVISRLLGPARTIMLLRYAALLSRESHFASVVLRRPLRFDHSDRR